MPRHHLARAVRASLAVAAVTAACAAPPAGERPAPRTDPRVGLKPGLFDAGEAVSGLRVLSTTPPSKDFVGSVNSDLAFTGDYAIQGSYNGFQVWDLRDATRPQLVTAFLCPASQSDVSVYRNLLFVSGEGLGGRLDCGTQGVPTAVSRDRLRGIRIFDISDIRNPRYIHNVQTCRGSHTHTVLEHPTDREHVYLYVSGSAGVRPAAELPGCSAQPPDRDPGSSLFRIEVIRVPLADPTKAAIVSSPRIFTGLVEPPRHGASPADLAELEAARRAGAFIAHVEGEPTRLPDGFTRRLLDSLSKARGGDGTPSAADSAALRAALPAIVARLLGQGPAGAGPRPGPTQCHDITVYPALGLAGGACEGYGLLLDISDPVNPRRIDAVSDRNFSYWHSATFSNDGSKLLFTDEWGGGGAPKCRADDPKEWGANAIFSIEDRTLRFRSYYKLPAPQARNEVCVAHNGSLIPVPGRDVMVQSWYEGGVSVFDFTDPARPVEIAYHDRGPSQAERLADAGTWSAYWYNGRIVSSEIARGLDVFELTPTPHLTQNEIDAANTVRLEYLNAQGQPRYVWPPSFALARAYVDQLERARCLAGNRLAAVRTALAEAERAGGAARGAALTALARSLDGDRRGCDDRKVDLLRQALQDLQAAVM
jgi:hypothetical protein